MIVYQLFCSPTYVHLCKCLSQYEIKKDLRKIRKILNFLFRKKPKQNYLEKTILKLPQKWALWQVVASVSAQRQFKIAHARW